LLSRDCKECECGNNPRFLTKTIAEIVLWAKAQKNIYKITNQMIAQKSGIPISTVNRFFSFEDGDVVDFKYITVHHIVTAIQDFMPHNDMPCPKGCNADNTAQINELMDKLQLLKADNESLKAQASRFEEQKALIIARYEAEADKKVNYIEKQCNRLRKTAAIMTALLLSVLFGIIGFLIYDITHPGKGWLNF
jgi:hypothetical protein